MHPAPSSSETSQNADTATLTRPIAIVLLIAFTLIWFAGLDTRKLMHPDEGRYAEIAREMAQSGDWVTPRLNGIKYFEKPALQYWIGAAAFDAFGVREGTARLWPALAGWLTVLFIGYTGLRIGGARVGLYAAAALGGCLWWVFNAHLLTLDAGLSWWMGAGLGSFLIAQVAATSAREQRAWMIAAWIALALAVLSKGLIGIVLPAAALTIYSLVERDLALWKRVHLAAGAVVFLAITAPWFVVVSLRNPEFFDFFFIHEHFTRFLTSEAKRVAPWWYFAPMLAVGLLPWLPVVVWETRRAWTGASVSANGFRWQRFALIWAAFIFVFFSLSGSKLPSYILPMFPALALIIAWQLSNTDDALLLRLSVPLVVLTGGVWLLLLFGYDAIARRLAGPQQPLAPFVACAPWLRSGVGIAFAGGVAGLCALQRGKRGSAVLTIAFSTLVAAQLLLTGYGAFAETRSSQPLLARISAAHGPFRADLPFYSVRMYDQTLPYYLGRTIIQVDHPDELEMGLASEPDKAIAQVSTWRAIWDRVPDAYAIMPPDDYAKLRRDGVPMRELGRDTRRVIVSRR
jgi:4-amino-4-deoxy-L-arabinose transferase-like glycosyltransferase